MNFKPITLFKNAYSGISREVWLISLAQLINRSGGMVIFFLSVYLNVYMKFSLTHVGILMALFGVGSFIGTFIGGKLIDKIGFYPIIIGSLGLGGIMFFVVAATNDFIALCILLPLLSVIGDSFRPASMTAIAHYSTKENYTRSISLNRLAINLGFSVGPAMGGILALINYKYIFYADGATCLMACLIVILIIGSRKSSIKNKVEEVMTEKVQSPYNDKIYLLFLPLAMLYAISFLQFFTTMPLYYKQVEHFSETTIGLLIALNGLIVAVVEMVMIYKIEKRWTIYNFIALGSFLIVISYLSLLFFSGIIWLIVLTIVMSFSEMFAMPFMNTLMNERSHSTNRGQYAALYAMAWSGAQTFTPIIATQIIQHAGFNTLWIVLAALAFIVMIGIKRLERIR